MAGEIIRPSALPDRPSPVASEKVPVDNGSTVGGATIQALVDAGRPLATQTEAEGGEEPTKAMTPLTTKQAIIAQGDARFASAAQGALADSATQPGDLAAVATTGSYADLTSKPTLGSAAAQNSTAFATAAQGGKADTALQSIVAGTNVSIDYTDPLNPIINGSASGTGDMVGPTGAAANGMVVFDGLTGKLTKDGGLTVDDGSLVWPPASSDFAPFHASVGGTANPHMYMGYNTLPNAILSDPTERGAIFGIEADYEPTPGTFWMEMYWQYNFDSGFTGDDCRRQIMAVMNKTTNVPVVLQLGGGPVQGVSFNIIDGAGSDQQKIIGKQKAEVVPHRFTVFTEAGGVIPAFNVQSDTGHKTGLEVGTRAASAGLFLTATSTGANESLYINPKGAGSAIIAGGRFVVDAPANGYSNIYLTEAGATKWRFYNDFANDRLFLLDADASAGVYIDQNGTSWAAASDRRLPYKETARTFSVLDKLDRFDVYEFDRPGGSLEIGVKAQELNKAFPGLVIEGADDDDRELDGLSDPGLWSIKADRAGFVALAGLKEVTAQLAQLQDDLRQAREEIAALKVAVSKPTK